MTECQLSHRILIISVLLFASASAVAAERHTIASSQAVGSGLGDEDYDEDFASNGFTSSNAEAEAGNGFAESHSYAGFKTVKVFALSRKVAGIAGGHGDSYAIASSTEKLTFFTPEAEIGQPITVVVSFNVSGEITGNADCPLGQTGWQAGAVLELYYGPSGFTNVAEVARGEFDNDPNSPNDNFETGAINIEVIWENGVAFDVMMHAFAWSDCTALGACTAEAKSALLDTFKWTGVASVADSKGNPISEFTLVDEFDNDWTTPASVADINTDGEVNVSDLLAVINSWGACPADCPPSCSADIAPPGGDCNVNVSDLLMVINSWG